MGPITHGNTGKCNKFKVSIHCDAIEDVVAFPFEIGKDKGNHMSRTSFMKWCQLGSEKKKRGLQSFLLLLQNDSYINGHILFYLFFFLDLFLLTFSLHFSLLTSFLDFALSVAVTQANHKGDSR